MFVKRCFDLVFSVLLTILSLSFMIIISFILLCTIGWPIIFSQIRPGLHGKGFRIYKFRTMKDTRDDAGTLLPDEMRLTGIGKFLRAFSLDELPQLFNIIRGNLSFVGPRPLLVEYLLRYTTEQARRHEVKPGITGWAQVNGRNTITWEGKFDLDIWYIDHRSFFLDMTILWLTLVKVLKREGINANGYATMPEFMGSAADDGKQ
jgi:sugar transferase EpsL